MKDTGITAVLFITIAVFLYIQDPYRRLTGHWHLASPIDETQLSFESATFDFCGKHGILQNMGLYNNSLFIIFDRIGNGLNITASECINEFYKYDLGGDSLKIHSLEGHLRFLGYKCSEDCCDLQKDYFLHTSETIDLPIVLDTSERLKAHDSRLSNGIVISNNIGNMTGYYRSEKVQLDSLVSEIKAEYLADPIEEKEFLLFADNTVPKRHIDSVYYSFTKAGAKNIFLVKRGDTDLKTSFIMYLEKLMPLKALAPKNEEKFKGKLLLSKSVAIYVRK